jgi:hypothetical protein
MATITEICACPRCKCNVDHQSLEAVKKGDLYYCGKQCAEGHQNYAGCGHLDCVCYSLPGDDTGKPASERVNLR